LSIATTTTYSQLFESNLQSRLNQPLSWKEVCDVTYSDTRTINSSYESTAPSAQSVTRNTGFDITTTAYIETNDTLTISTGRDVGYTVDLGDESQSPWTKPGELFGRIGSILNEFIESHYLADHASWTDFGTSSIGGGGAATTPITVSASNIDDIIRGVKREIRENNAWELATQQGVCFVWRPADFEYLEAFVQAWNKILGLIKSLLINGETLRHKAKATLSKQVNKITRQLQRLSEGTLLMSEATVRTT